MKQIHFLLALIFSLASTLTFSQDFDHYQPIVCSGPVPDKILTASSTKIQSDMTSIAGSRKSKEEIKGRIDFSEKINFNLDDLMRSGKVLYDDPVSIYLEKVLDNILEHQPDLKGKVEIYTLRSAVPNAFADARGSIFFSLGLMGRLQTESQLAFILCHEISHIKQAHSLGLYLKSRDMSKFVKSENQALSILKEDYLKNIRRFSREQEQEADQLGLELFLKCGYGTDYLGEVFDILKLSYLPEANLPFDRDFLTYGNFQLPESYWLEQVPAVGTLLEKANPEDSLLSTHPDAGLRKERLLSGMQTGKSVDAPDFLVSQLDFLQAKNIARFESPMLHLQNDEFDRAIYDAFLVLQDFPHNEYLQSIVAKSLYLLSKYKNNLQYNGRNMTEQKEGELLQLSFLLNSLDTSSVTTLAMSYVWPLTQDFPENKELKTILEDLSTQFAGSFSSLDSLAHAAEKHRLPYSWLRKDKLFSQSDSVNQDSVTTGSSKQSGGFFLTPGAGEDAKSGSKKRPTYTQSDTVAHEIFWKNIIPEEWLADTGFVGMVAKGKVTYDQNAERRAYYRTEAGREEYRKYRKNVARHGLALGINKVVVVDPKYMAYREKKSLTPLNFRSEEGQKAFSQTIRDMAKKAHLSATILDTENLSEKDTETMNEARFLNEWFSQQLDYNDLSPTQGLQQAQVEAIADKYGTDYFMWIGAIDVWKHTWSDVAGLFSCMIMPPVAPLFAIRSTRHHYLTYFAFIYDVRTAKHEVVLFHSERMTFPKGRLEQLVFDSMNQVHAK